MFPMLLFDCLWFAIVLLLGCFVASCVCFRIVSSLHLFIDLYLVGFIVLFVVDCFVCFVCCRCCV